MLIVEADDRKVMELSLIENLQREDLNPMEEAAGHQKLMNDFGLTQEEAPSGWASPGPRWPTPCGS